TLWPLMHGLVSHAHADATEYETWWRVNRRFAQQLAPLLRPTDLVWVHDYHLMPLGSMLREQGWRGALGYFHHIPIPVAEVWQRIPHADDVAMRFRAYDLVAVQTERDRARLAAYVPEPHPILKTLPIGIDPGRMRSLAKRDPDD